MHDVAIPRARWLRGMGDGVLLNENGCRCVTGWICASLGIPDDILLDEGEISEIEFEDGMPASLAVLHDYLSEPEQTRLVGEVGPHWFDFEGLLIGLNDDTEMGDVQRERLIARVSETRGFRVTFEGDGHPR